MVFPFFVLPVLQYNSYALNTLKRNCNFCNTCEIVSYTSHNTAAAPLCWEQMLA